MPDKEPQQQGRTLNTDNPFILDINPGWMKTLPEDTLKQTNPGTSDRNTVPERSKKKKQKKTDQTSSTMKPKENQNPDHSSPEPKRTDASFPDQELQEDI
ncbi:hypothetical protein H0H81_007941 [Sphagnurus paluster]|uniref:Uncharacterized protein n=1 Tax=Sphagnurus paluster TaxID=117069 RepID=A0A9P7K1X2_9AGAR|nr:hypothetical protein H0H81_007008 [Sphagnurus paluster]KAG5646260.1 hypothetical protein H0H81_008566 [Sphagnurus paluster]KAG5647117.1 hypothetical protein H0H81_007941 [Sphagnurus paluster]